MTLFSMSAVINWQGDIVRLISKLHSKGVVGVVMNPFIQKYYINVKPLYWSFKIQQASKKILPDVLEALDNVESEEELMSALNNPSVKDRVDAIVSQDKELIEVKKMAKTAVSRPVQLYYGVFDSNGLEFFCPAEYWESDDIQIRTGGHLWWLQWCKNGGRSGSSMPFSAWMTKEDAEWITKGEGKKEAEERSEFILWLMREGMPNGYPFAQWLWPWKQHMDYLSEQTFAEAAAGGYSKSDANELYQSKIRDYFNNRQKGEGLLPVEYDFY